MSSSMREPAKRLRGGDGSIFSAKCQADLNRRRGESRGDWKERLSNSNQRKKSREMKQAFGQPPLHPGEQQVQGLQGCPAAALQPKVESPLPWVLGKTPVQKPVSQTWHWL